jgi:DNA-binding Lrp family transcriptional regulator
MGEPRQDMEWVVKGPHASMVIKRPIDVLEEKILSLLSVDGGMRLSQIWLRCSCHLWEVSLALERLKEKGLVEESGA